MTAALTLYRGDSRLVRLVITDPENDNAPVDLTDSSLWFYVKASTQTPDQSAIIAKGPDDITLLDQNIYTGQATVELDPVDTESIPSQYLDTPLLWEVQLSDSTDIITTVSRGTMVIQSDVVLDPSQVIPTGPTFTYDPTTPNGKVRLLAQDFDRENAIFSDDEIQAFMDMNEGDFRYAAASALEVIAANEAYVQKKIKLLDLWTDGSATAAALMKLATSLRGLSDQFSSEEEQFSWAEQVVNTFTARERVYKEYLRNA